MQHNQRVMMRLVAHVRTGTVVGAKRSMRMIHGGTVRPFGASPGTPVDTREAMSGGRVALNTDPTFRPPDEAPFYPILGDDEIDTALIGMRLGDAIHWRNRVPYSGVLEGGRRFSSALGRMVGSDQAPTGFLKHTITETKVRMEAWEYKGASQ